MAFSCLSCGRLVGPTATQPRCGECGGFLRYVEEDVDNLRAALDGDVYAALPDVADPIRMGEGDTPLVDVETPAGVPGVVGKLESMNPTCSFKDRGSSLLVSTVRDAATDWEGIVVASTGNTATSVAAYAARADVPCAVLVPDGTSLTKVAQAAAHGARIFTVSGSFSDCFQLAQRVRSDRIANATAVYSANPFVAAANRTVAFELVKQLGEAPDWVTVPVGAGPLLGGCHFGFRDLAAAGLVDSLPKMACVQSRGCHPIVRAFERKESVEAWTEPITTSVGAIADPLVGYPEDGELTRRAVIESNGTAVALADDHVHAWTDRLADDAGIYVEPASAAAAAAVEKVSRIEPDDTVAALLTGHGLKEPPEETPPTESIDGDEAVVRDALLE